jgi:hypothetical protein
MEDFCAADGIFNTFLVIKILIRLEFLPDGGEDIFSLGDKLVGEVKVSGV